MVESTRVRSKRLSFSGKKNTVFLYASKYCQYETIGKIAYQ